MGLSVGGLIYRGAYVQIEKEDKWDDRHDMTESKSLLEKMKEMYWIIHVFSLKKICT